MNKRYDWTLYSVFMFVSFLFNIISPDSTIKEEGGKSIYIFSIIMVIILGLFLIYKFKGWYQNKIKDKHN